MAWSLVRSILNSMTDFSGQGGLAGYAEDIRRPDLLIVEGDRALVTNPKRRDRETAILGKSQGLLMT